MSNLDKTMGDTLALVNMARQAYGHDPLNDLPVAHPGNSSECLYARALKDIGVTGVSGNGSMSFASERVASYVASLWGVEAQGATVPSPTQFGQVIVPFDEQKLTAYNDRP